METTAKTQAHPVINPEALLAHWQGHRGLTRRVIEAFPEKELFSYSIGGMRTFALLAMEMIDLAGPGMDGIVTGEWMPMEQLPHSSGNGMPQTKEELLKLWDSTTEQIDRLWPKLQPEDFGKTVVAFGMYESSVTSTLLYFIDNENHHRGQGYVYLRGLGIEPPYFWER